MPHLSKNKVRRKVFKKIEEEFVEVLTALTSRPVMKRLVSELLTPTEQTMLAKRLALVLMLKKSYPFETIQKTLKLTPQTVARYWRKLKAGEFQYLLPASKKPQGDMRKFLDALETLMRAGLPPRGRGRWTHVLKNLK